MFQEYHQNFIFIVGGGIKFLFKGWSCFFGNISQSCTLMPRPFWRPSREADVGVNLLFAINPVHDIEVTHFIIVCGSDPSYSVSVVYLKKAKKLQLFLNNKNYRVSNFLEIYFKFYCRIAVNILPWCIWLQQRLLVSK